MSEESDGDEVVNQIRRRKRYSVKEKLRIVSEIQEKVENGSTISEAVRGFSIHRKQFTEWRKMLPKLEEVMTINFRAKSLCPGPQSLLTQSKEISLSSYSS